MQLHRTIPAQAVSSRVLAIGNFDGLHLGHRALLERLTAHARWLGLPAAVMTFEPHPRELFTPDQAPARLTSLREKLALLEACGVEEVYLLHFSRKLAGLTAEDFIKQILVRGLAVRHLIIGDDFRFGAKRTGDFALLQKAGDSLGFRVETMDSVTLEGERASSSAVREALGSGRLEHAARLLGRPYSIDGRVVHGDKIGRQLGFATANIRMKHERPPLLGVFAVEVRGIDGGMRKGVANLGFRPSANQVLRPILEVHLFDFAADIYGAHLNVRFLHKLRDEMKFPNFDALKAQIASDVETAKNYFKV